MESVQQEFYSPLCKNGYLTPLQRMKLREKRKLDSSFLLEDTVFTKLKKVKKSSEKRCRKKKVSVSSRQCFTPKHHETEGNVAGEYSKKFFKTPPSSRLQKARFLISFPSKNNFPKPSIKIKPPLKKEYVCKDNMMIERKDNVHDQSSFLVTDGSVHDDSVSSDKQTSHDETNIPKIENDIFDFAWPSDDILLLRQEKARSNQQESIMSELNVSPKSINFDASKETASKKLYPIFQVHSNVKQTNPPAHKDSDPSSKSFFKISNSDDQLIIDAGQTEFGPKICSTCNMLYNIGHEEDEKLHSSYHSMFLINLKFPGWKNENVIGEYPDGRVIMVHKEEQSFKLKKIEDVLMIANKDLGSPDTLPEKPGLVFLLFVSNDKCVAGCLVAEPISSGHKIMFSSNTGEDSLPVDIKISENLRCYSSAESFPAVCGINRIWVSKKYRRCKIASRMLDCLRCNFIHGHVVNKLEIAFLDPATDGRKLAASYLETNCFLVYK